MRTKVFLRNASFFAFFVFISLKINGQCVIGSSDGYFVTVSVKPVEIIPASANCAYGYSYQVKLNYTIGFSGINIPSSLYTLQGVINCNGNSIFFDLPNGASSGNVISSTSYTSLTNCSNPSVSSLGCSAVQIEIQGPGISAQTISCPLASALPVSYTSFNVKINDAEGRLTWSTGWEENNAFFTVERSDDGILYHSIATLPGKGNATMENWYSYTDKQLYPGTFLYRIRQTDLNGKFTFSEVQKITYNQKNRLAVTPNPVTGSTVTIQGIDNLKGKHAQIFDTNGQMVYETTLLSARFDLPANLKTGSYVITLISTNGERQHLRFVKL